MAVVNTLSIGVHDFQAGRSGRKTIPLYVPDTLSLANVATLLADLLPKLDLAIDPYIQDARIDLNLALPGGLKTSAIVGQSVNIGANLSYDAAATNFAYSAFIPGWKNGGFAGEAVINTGVYADLIAEFTTLSLTNEFGSNLDAFLGGLRAKRK